LVHQGPAQRRRGDRGRGLLLLAGIAALQVSAVVRDRLPVEHT
jgi:hypothetical protein